MTEGNVVMRPFSPELGWPSYQQSRVERWRGQQQSVQLDYVAEEVPVALVYNGQPHVVMLATPANIEDFALGFSITEGIIETAAELLSFRIYNHANGIEARIKIPESRFEKLPGKNRNLTGRTGCGLCGAATLRQAVRDVKPVSGSLELPAAELYEALNAIRETQSINQLTGAVHAAAWLLPGQGIQYVREDVGRHNALDKLIGALLKMDRNPAEGFLIMTSRASYELVQKASSVGITFLAAMSAPTGLAVRLAEEAGMTLVGFARGDQHVVYSYPERLTHHSIPTLIT